MAMAELRTVKFLRMYRLYNAGETAGFEEADARLLVSSGIAAFDPPETEETVEEKQAPPAPVDRMMREPSPKAPTPKAPAEPKKK